MNTPDLSIASKHSLKSEACHYEITEAREKYNKLWADIFIPIHIDSYLFTTRKEEIPNQLFKIYWGNIIELKEFYSLDFTFVKNNYKNESCKQFQELLNSLKIKKDANII